MTLDFDDGTDATRGDFWTFSGRLYDIDTAIKTVAGNKRPRLSRRSIHLDRDHCPMESSRAGLCEHGPERGNGHVIQVVFEGTQEHLSTLTNGSVTVCLLLSSHRLLHPLVVRSAQRTESNSQEVLPKLAELVRCSKTLSCMLKRLELCEQLRRRILFKNVELDWNVGNFSIVVTSQSN